MSREAPGPGKRVRATLADFEPGDIHYSLYLPVDWTPTGSYPVVVEYAGNGHYRDKWGDVCTGRVEDCSLGYGLTGGRQCIWICLPFVDLTHRCNALRWWGDVDATVRFCEEAVATVCANYRGDPKKVLICGFSRGALACNYIGLHDDKIARLWCAFWPASHYDGARKWPYPDSDRASAIRRLKRLGNRPVFVSHEAYDIDPDTYTIVDTMNYLASTGQSLRHFVFQLVPIHNHTDRWVLYDIPARDNLRAWFDGILASR